MRDIQNLYNDVSEIIVSSQQNAVRSVNCCRVQMYWRIGKRILETEQNGRERAEYGAYLLKNLAKKLEPEYGSGFSYRQLYFCRQFYRMYPIMNTLRSQFNWTQYRLLLAISDDYKREYYELDESGNRLLATTYGTGWDGLKNNNNYWLIYSSGTRIYSRWKTFF